MCTSWIWPHLVRVGVRVRVRVRVRVLVSVRMRVRVGVRMRVRVDLAAQGEDVDGLRDLLTDCELVGPVE